MTNYIKKTHTKAKGQKTTKFQTKNNNILDNQCYPYI